MTALWTFITKFWHFATLIYTMLSHLESNPATASLVSNLEAKVKTLTHVDVENLLKDVGPGSPVAALGDFLTHTTNWVDTPYEPANTPGQSGTTSPGTVPGTVAGLPATSGSTGGSNPVAAAGV